MDVISAKEREHQEATPDLASLREADAILIGEVHDNRAHQEEQARLITEIQPEYILHEGWDEATPDETRRIIRSYAIVTLQDLVERAYSLQRLGITSDVLPRIQQKKRDMHDRYGKLGSVSK